MVLQKRSDRAVVSVQVTKYKQNKESVKTKHVI